jgi:hypothetical protein
MKTMASRDAKNDSPADTLIPELFMDKETGHDEWVATKIGKTLWRVESGAAELHSHTDAQASLDARIAAKRVR